MTMRHMRATRLILTTSTPPHVLISLKGFCLLCYHCLPVKAPIALQTMSGSSVFYLKVSSRGFVEFLLVL